MSQAFYIDNDVHMYDPLTDTPPLARTSNMNGDLGMVEYVFSDKTGTLTKNRMTVVRVYTNNQVFKAPKDAKVISESLMDNIGLAAAINSQSKSLYVMDAKTHLPNQQGNKVRESNSIFFPSMNISC